MEQPFLTIITPTYNRAELLKKAYQSLREQTCFDFEWIVVDDGSSDDTRQVIGDFQTEKFPIIPIFQENGGKHRALNAAIPHVHGRYVLILDSDDFLTPDAVETVRCCWERYAANEKIGLVTFLRGVPTGGPISTVADYDTPVDILRYRRNRIHGSDCCEVLRTELLRQYPFPTFPGEKFISECALWNRIARTHQCVYIDRIIYICEYLPGGLTDSGRAMRIRNPRGGMFTSQLRMCRKNFLTQRIKYGLLYVCYGRFAGMSQRQILKENPYKMLTALCLLPGDIMYRLWKKRYLRITYEKN